MGSILGNWGKKWFGGGEVSESVTGNANQFFFPINGGWSFRRESDEQIIENGFLGNDAVYSVIHKIALNGSMLPINLKKGEDIIESGPVYDLLYKPNDYQSRQEYLYEALVYLALTGKVYFYKDEPSIGMGVKKLWVLPSQFVEIVKEDESDIFSPIKFYRFTNGARTKNFFPEQIIHIRYFDPSYESREGLSPLQAGAYLVDSNNQLSVAENFYFKNRGASKVISADSEFGLTNQDKERLDSAFKDRAGGAWNVNKVLFSGSPIKVMDIDGKPSDLSINETSQTQLRRICSLFSVPAELFNAEKSGQFNTRKEALKTMYNEGIIPVVQMILAAEDRSLLSTFDKTLYQEVDKTKIEALNPDAVEKQDQDRKDVEDGLMTPNEYRTRRGLPTLEGPENDQVRQSSRPNINITGNGSN